MGVWWCEIRGKRYRVMMKKVKDITFEEFDKWANDRACDGGWGIGTAIVCIEAINVVLAVKPIFWRKKAREKKVGRNKGKVF